MVLGRYLGRLHILHHNSCGRNQIFYYSSMLFWDWASVGVAPMEAQEIQSHTKKSHPFAERTLEHRLFSLEEILVAGG